MRTLFTLSLIFLFSLPLQAQLQKANSLKWQIKPRQRILIRYDGHKDCSVEFSANGELTPPEQGSVEAPASPFSPVTLGRSYTGRSFQANTVLHPLVTKPEKNSILFIHPQDQSLYGGPLSPRLRYDLSVDGGLSFTTDIGPVADSGSVYNQHPSALFSGIEDTSSSSPFDDRVIWCSVDSINGRNAGFGGGATAVSTGPLSNETAFQVQDSILLLGGLSASNDSTFWQVAFSHSGDSLFIYRGSYDLSSGAVIWSRQHSFAPPHYLPANGGNPVFTAPNLSVSPDGADIWVAWMGDLSGGSDSVLNPCLLHSNDGGMTWDSTATEVDIRTTGWVADSLQSYWTVFDSASGTLVSAGTGRPTTTPDFDLTVDIYGNPHIAVVVGNAGIYGDSTPNYEIAAGIGKFLADISSPDNGINWEVSYLAPILAYEGEFGSPDPNDGSLLPMRNFVQNSRTADGSRIFFSWVDSDTNITGFGTFTNIHPNLYQTAIRVIDGYQTCFHSVSEGDFNWDGRILFPWMAPEVLTSSSGNRHYLPVVFIEMINNDQLGPIRYHYVGDQAQIIESCFMDPSKLNLHWEGGCGLMESTGPGEEGVGRIHLYPNPAQDYFRVEMTAEFPWEINVEIHDLSGKLIKRLPLVNGERVYTDGLKPGLYLVTIVSPKSSHTEKLMITQAQ